MDSFYVCHPQRNLLRACEANPQSKDFVPAGSVSWRIKAFSPRIRQENSYPGHDDCKVKGMLRFRECIRARCAQDDKLAAND
jgi:hypothetical protein